MEFFDLKDISERYMELINPISTEKVLEAGRYAGLLPGHRVIDFGCGFGEVLALWAEHYGISGIGIDIRAYACDRARQKMVERGLRERIEIVQGSGAEYHFDPGTFDLAACIGATFIWGGFRQAIRAMRQVVRPLGRLIVGEVFWQKSKVPPEFAQGQREVNTEQQLVQHARQEGYDILYMVRASQDDWTRYESSNWYGLSQWIESNPEHPEIQQVTEYLHSSQDEYFLYGREYFGWGIFVLTPMNY
jgi:ubiquinone/menaquinone biosynthesis C-methylase UbiE